MKQIIAHVATLCAVRFVHQQQNAALLLMASNFSKVELFLHQSVTALRHYLHPKLMNHYQTQISCVIVNVRKSDLRSMIERNSLAYVKGICQLFF